MVGQWAAQARRPGGRDDMVAERVNIRIDKGSGTRGASRQEEISGYFIAVFPEWRILAIEI